VQRFREEWGQFMGPLIGRLVRGEITVDEAEALYREHFADNEGEA
jgi:hypothetical protein